MKPLIGITVGEIQNALYSWAPIVYGQSHPYCEAVERAGGVPVLIPIMTDANNLLQLYEVLDGVLFAGGNDINPELYEEQRYKTTIDCSEKRDNTEILLAEWSLNDQKPVLGICRGMQLLNVASGGTLYQYIPTDIVNALDHEAGLLHGDPIHLAHSIRIDPKSRLSRILNSPNLETNSLHHQSVKDLGTNLKAVAWSKDGVIEAIESADDSYIFGIQSHPETLEANTVPEFRKLFASLIDASAIQKRKPLPRKKLVV